METNKKFIDHASGQYMLRVAPSIFTTRNGLFDLSIARRATWGAREDNGELYTTTRRIAAESQTTLCDYGHTHPEVIETALRFLTACHARPNNG